MMKQRKSPMYAKWVVITLIAVVGLFFGLCQTVTAADKYPSRAVTIINPLRPGGGTDIELRNLAPFVQKYLGEAVVVKSMPEDFEVAMERNRFGGRMGTSEFYRHQQLGMTVIEMTDAFAAQLGYEGVAGALIMHVDPESIAAQAGLREGMLITRVGDTDIKSTAEFREAIEKESLERGITLQVRSGRRTKTVTLQSS